MNLIQKADSICISGKDDENDSTTAPKFQKPDWFDVRKFDLGKRYFHENRVGMLMATMSGLLLMFAFPKGLAVLNGAGRSSTFIPTILHIVSWYDYPLNDDSK